MGRRILWNRKQWTDAMSAECAQAGHEPVPCEEHEAQIEAGIERHAALANSPETTAATQAWIERNTRPGEVVQTPGVYVPDPKPTSRSAGDRMPQRNGGDSAPADAAGT